MPQPRTSTEHLPAWARRGLPVVVAVVLLVITAYWPQYSPYGPPYSHEKEGYSGLVVETGSVTGLTYVPDYDYIIVEEAPGRRVKHYLPPNTPDIMEGYHVIKEPGYDGRVYSPDYEDLKKQIRVKEYKARQKR